MKTLLKHTLFLACSMVVLFNCSGGDGGGSEGDQDNPPSAATLQFPEQNSECTDGTNITDTKSTISFDWSDAQNATSYQLVLKNLATQSTSTHNANESNLALEIDRGTPYSWYIVSRNSGTQTAQSSTWKFYNAGDPETSYAPFPADLVSPEMGVGLPNTTTTVTLQWSGSDVDNDIEGYEVLFGTSNQPTNSLGNTTSTTKDVTVNTGNDYYWKIITTDAEGNSSTSEIFQFKVK
ncbi:hypothetical protein [Aegicerativicinus sediminis]